jgi:hypothetical protein
MKIFSHSLVAVLLFSSAAVLAEDASVTTAVSDSAPLFDKAKALQQYIEINGKTVPGISDKTTHGELLSLLSNAGKDMNVPEVGQVILTAQDPECKAIITPSAMQVWAKAILSDVPNVPEIIGTYLCQGITAGYTPVDEETLTAFAEKASKPSVMKGADGKDYTVPASNVTVVKGDNGMAHLTIAATSGSPTVTMVKPASADNSQPVKHDAAVANPETTVTGKPMPSADEQAKLNPVPADFVASSTFPADVECNGKDPDAVYNWRYFNCNAADPRFVATVDKETRISAANAALKAESQKANGSPSADAGNAALTLGSK